jgi:hypothetical protein
MQEYKGTYPKQCMLRVRQDLIKSLKPKEPGSDTFGTSNYSDRITEILKLKLYIVSKFDGDERLKRRIKRDTYNAARAIEENIAMHDRLIKENRINKYVGDYGWSSASTSILNHIHFSDQIPVIDLVSDSETSTSTDNDERNEEDVIEMINEQSTINLSDIDENLNDKRSHKYNTRKQTKLKESIKSKNDINNLYFESKKPIGSKLNGKTSSTTTATTSNKLKNNSINKDDADKLEELEKNYTTLRNRRNKIRRKTTPKKKSKNGPTTSSLDKSLELEIINGELKKQRRLLSRLRTKMKSSNKFTNKKRLNNKKIKI